VLQCRREGKLDALALLVAGIRSELAILELLVGVGPLANSSVVRTKGKAAGRR